MGFLNIRREKRNKKQVGENHFPGRKQLLWGPPVDPAKATGSAGAGGSRPRQ